MLQLCRYQPRLARDAAWGDKDPGGEPRYVKARLAADRGMPLGTEDDLWRRLGIGAQGVVSALANFVPGKS
jgi:dihydrodipicolinate synthase/N-acetylneuraminate lyase